jgi:methyl-accepting chemotaxis protein
MKAILIIRRSKSIRIGNPRKWDEQEISGMTVGGKLSLGVGALALVIAGISASSLYSTSQLGLELNRSANETGTKLILGGELQAQILTLRSAQRGMVLHALQNNQAKVVMTTNEFEEGKQNTNRTLAALRPLLKTDRERALVNAIADNADAYYPIIHEMSVLCAAGESKAAYDVLNTRGASIAPVMQKAAQEYIDLQRAQLQESALAGAARVQSARWMGLVGCLFGIVFATAVGIVVRRITLSLRVISRDLGSGAGQIVHASGQLSRASLSLARDASTQAASLEETAAGSNEVTSMIQRNAEGSKAAATVMSTVDDRVAEGNRTLDLMVVSMTEIASSSTKISKIIKVIDGIAFQTNILALNAAVEAARAGAAGMSFAVVADEVRNLAQRSAQAARDTADLIAESIATSHEGGSRLNRVTEVVHSITEAAAQVKVLVDQVSLGSQEQAQGVDAISRSIHQMEEITQRTAANSEETASSSEELSAQAQVFRSIVVKLQVMVGKDR